MTDLDFENEMTDAVAVLRERIEDEPIPFFTPTQSRAPLLVAAAAVVILGLGVVWGVLSQGSDESGRLVVATQPDTNERAGPEEPVVAAVDAGPEDTGAVGAGPEATQDDATQDEGAEAAPQRFLTQGDPLPGQLTNAGPGQFIVPSPGSSAWNADETAILLYRTGDGPVGHIVVSAVTGEMIGTVDLDPPDIEQLYWHPTDPSVVVTVEGDAVWSFDILSRERTVLHRFADCIRGDANAGLPSPPSTRGDLVLLCTTAGGQQLARYNLVTGVDASMPVDAAVDSVHISPSGSTVISIFDDDSAVARTAGSDLTLDLGGDSFDFVTVGNIEMVASVQYSGDSVGSVVLYDLTDGSAEVVIGPDAGDEYPPTGSLIHASGSRIVLSTAGTVEGELGGRVLLIDLERAGDEIVAAITHESLRDNNGYWSDVFVSLSPTGRYLVYSSDRGGGSSDTTVVEFPP